MSLFSASRPSRKDVVFLACVALSLVVSFAMVANVDSPFADLVSAHTDHIHHTLATWTFFHRGFEVYRRPFGEIATPYPHYAPTWPQLPIPYPPGMFALFLPPALLGAWVPMGSLFWARCVVLWIVAWSHLGLVGMWSALSRLRGGLAPLLLVIWFLTLRMCLCGFYDAVWLGCVGMSVAALADRRALRSLLWFTGAFFLSYRAAAAIPVAGLAAWLLLRGDAPRRTKVWAFLFVGSTCLFILWTFWLFSSNSPPASSPVYSNLSTPLLPFGIRGFVVSALGVAMAIFALGAGDALAAVTIAMVTVLTILHAGPSWHGSLLVVPALLVGVGTVAVRRSARNVVLIRNVLAIWFIVIQEFAYRNTPSDLIELILHAKFR